MGAERWDEQVGSVADEAGRLLESLRRSAAEAAAAAAASDGAAADPASEDPTTGETGHDPVCQWCPICRGASVVRSLSPETLTRLADLAGVAASVLADLASARASADPTTSDASDVPVPRRAEPPASRPIPVRDAGDPQEAPHG